MRKEQARRLEEQKPGRATVARWRVTMLVDEAYIETNVSHDR
jgi:hypothetical protein